jgi:hypothetical protein
MNQSVWEKNVSAKVTGTAMMTKEQKIWQNLAV